jgi:cyanophycin synthetase
MRLVDSWRLMGPSLYARVPVALAQVAFDAGENPEAAFVAWMTELARIASAVELAYDSPASRFFRGGATFTFAARIDALLLATHATDKAVEAANARLAGEAPPAFDAVLAELALVPRGSAALIALEDEARRRGVPFLWDDDAVTLGMGKRSRTFAMDALPDTNAVPWPELGAIPVVLVTGTNGKTTTSRLVAKMVRGAGLVVGCTTTDVAKVGDRVVDRGDCTGPAGARLVLRDRETEAAVLETARGGILRRGLAVDEARGAIVTNVTADHLGHYGVMDVPTMARVKGVVGDVVVLDGRVVLNAEDPELVALAPSYRAPVAFFSLDPRAPALVAHVARGGEGWFLRDDALVRSTRAGERTLAKVDEVPIGFRGAARFNLANALGAAALASTMEISEDAIVDGLRTFQPSFEDNPGRSNLVERNGVQIMVDFAHNPDGLTNVFALVEKIRSRAGRLAILCGYGGDRSDESMRASANLIRAQRPALVVLRDLAGYQRGRQEGEVRALFRAELVARGMHDAEIEDAPSEVESLRRALAWAKPNDMVVILAHLESAGVRALLKVPSS